MAQFGDSATDINAILKMLYPKGLPLDSAYKTSRLLGMIKKRALKGAGLGTKIPVHIGNVGSVSATFSDAIGTNQSGPTYRAFEVDVVQHYAGAGITGLAIAKTGGDEGAFVEAVKSTMDSALYSLGRANSAAIYGDGSGAVGTIASAGVNPTVLTLGARDMRNFEIGQRIAVYDTTGVTLRAGGPHTITAVNRNAATITVTPAVTGGVATDVVYKAGNKGLMMYGLQSWVPATNANLGTAFGGVTRTADEERLAGLRASLTGLTDLEACVRALRLMADAGAMTDHMFVSPTRFESIATLLGARDKAERMTVKSFDGVHGYSAIKLVGGGSGECNLVMDPDCPDNLLFALELDTWEIVHAGGGFPFVDETDGNKTLRSATSDGIDFRVKQYAQLLCHAPGKNGTFTIE